MTNKNTTKNIAKQQSAVVKANEKLENNAISLNTNYDEVAYPSHAYRKTRPDTMAVAAHLFGLETPKIENARVLELGCASGGNLIPMAEAFPNAEFLGVDLSERQIKVGQETIKALNLKNIELRQQSILDLTKKTGTFDFIIVHGVFSWVPENVQDKILEVCNKNLSKNGVAYISYNTLPGWNIAKTVRDMMLFHSRKFDNPQDKILESRRMLKFVSDNTGQSSPFSATLKAEMEVLSKANDNYLFHDHLEEQNTPFYLEEFVAKAEKNNLRYLADADIATMYLGNQSKKVRETLGKLTDIVEQEQYLDFLTNRRFRSTLLCHKEVELSREVNSNKMKDLFFASMCQTDLAKIDFTKNDPVIFKNPLTQAEFTSNNRIVTALLSILADARGCFFSCEEIVKAASKKLNDVDMKQVELLWLDTSIKLLFAGHLDASLCKGVHTNQISKTPKVSDSARYLARSGALVPNMLHQVVKIGDDVRVLVQYTTGKNTADQILDLYFPHFAKGELTFNDNSDVTQNEQKLRKKVKENLEKNLNFLAMNSLLIA